VGSMSVALLPRSSQHCCAGSQLYAGTILDLAEVTPQAMSRLAESGFAAGYGVVEGDFFATVS
jgi:hypothetical protein